MLALPAIVIPEDAFPAQIRIAGIEPWRLHAGAGDVDQEIGEGI